MANKASRKGASQFGNEPKYFIVKLSLIDPWSVKEMMTDKRREGSDQFGNEPKYFIVKLSLIDSWYVKEMMTDKRREGSEAVISVKFVNFILTDHEMMRMSRLTHLENTPLR
ncbi:MAG: hypothetical protein EBE86_016110 [Hormoscilla sp. GUM202]|nr:hypothetical protein [Hormoscilla sp. GUM202]